MNNWRIPYPKFGKGPGLCRIAALAERLGVHLPRFGTHGAVIVGSNGKGSTAAICARLLEQSGSDVGLFTSPHLLALNERFRINDADISDAELDKHWNRVVSAIDEADLGAEIGGFEFLFLVAVDWFAARGCRHTVWEAGIGGRMDAVRLIQAKRVALTSLDLEHTQLLGDTLAEIARDKIEAAPAGSTLFVSQSCLPVRHDIDLHCVNLGIQPVWLGAHHSAPLRGAHQRENAALALALAQDVLGPHALRPALVERGMRSVRWPGRLETVSHDPRTIVDVGHTPAGVKAALAAFRESQGGCSAVLVCGASRDKDAEALISALAPSFSTVICTAAFHKGCDPSDIAAFARAAHPHANIITSDNITEARAVARESANQHGAIVYVAGGLFLAAEYRALEYGCDPLSIEFF